MNKYLLLTILFALLIGCNKQQNGFVGKYANDSSGLDGGSYAGSTKRYILAGNMNSAGKNISVLSFKPFSATQEPYKNFSGSQNPYYSSNGSTPDYDKYGFYNLPPQMANVKREQELDFQVGMDPIAMEISQDNSVILTANYSAGTISVVDIASLHNRAGNATEKSSELAAIPVGQGPTKIAIAKNLALVVNRVSRDISVLEINGASSRLITNVRFDLQGKKLQPTDVAISRDGNYALITYTNDFLIGAMNLKSNPKMDPKKYIIEPYRALNFQPKNVLFTPYTNTIIITGDSRLIVHNLDLPDEFFVMPDEFSIGGLISDVAISKDGLYIAVTEETTYTVTIIKSSNFANNAVTNPQKVIDYFKNKLIAPDPSQETTYDGNLQNNFWMLDSEDFRIVAKFQLKEKPVKVAIDSRTNKFAVVTTQNPGTVVVIYLNDSQSKIVGQIRTGSELSDIIFI